jgi:hypothetical protein
MYFLGWILLIVVGLGASFWALVWALRTGQFAEQERARFLPLEDGVPRGGLERSSKLTVEVYFLILVVGMGFAAFVGAVILTLGGTRG